MAKICDANRKKEQFCYNCKWFRTDEDRSSKYGQYVKSCFNPNKDIVHWEAKNNE